MPHGRSHVAAPNPTVLLRPAAPSGPCRTRRRGRGRGDGCVLCGQLVGQDHVHPVRVRLADGSDDAAGVVGIEGGDQRRVLGRGGGRGDLGVALLGQLHGPVPDTAGGAGDQRAVAGLELGGVHRGECGGPGQPELGTGGEVDSFGSLARQTEAGTVTYPATVAEEGLGDHAEDRSPTW